MSTLTVRHTVMTVGFIGIVKSPGEVPGFPRVTHSRVLTMWEIPRSASQVSLCFYNSTFKYAGLVAVSIIVLQVPLMTE